MVRKTAVVQTLQERRHDFVEQLEGIRVRRAEAVTWLQASEEAWRSALAAGGACDQEIDARRTAEANVAELDRSAEQVSAWLAEVDQQLAAKAPHDALDTAIAEYRADVAAFADEVRELDGRHEAAVTAVVAAVREMHQTVRAALDGGQALGNRARALRAETARLERQETIPDPPAWQTPLEHELRGTDLWRFYISTVKDRTNPPQVAEGLFNAVMHRVNTQRGC